MKFNIRTWFWTGGTFLATMFAACVVYGLIVPATLHASSTLETFLPAFKWISFGSFLLGLAETFVYGALAGSVFAAIHNFYEKRYSERALKQFSKAA